METASKGIIILGIRYNSCSLGRSDLNGSTTWSYPLRSFCFVRLGRSFVTALCSFFRFLFGRWWIVLIVAMCGVAWAPPSAVAQAPLYLVDDQTSVREVSFRFVGGKTFDTDRLREQIATAAPGFFARLQNQFSFLPGLQRQAFLFDPVTLQKDVVRLRRFYQQNGFPRPQIDYPVSQLDTASNEIHVIFTVQEGTPLTIRNVSFLGPEGTQPVTNFFGKDLERGWAEFRTRSTVQPGERYTDFKRTQISNEVQTWLRNRGYAFATVEARAEIDTAATAVELRFLMDPGPLTTISHIRVEGNTSVSDRIVRRELPFKEGDRFSAQQVSDGQRQLFDLNLFRVALADVPEQPRDSTVTVRYRVREAKLRAYSGQIGYGTRPGITMEGSWRHRNFHGNARTLVVNLTADTGFPEDPARIFPFLSTSTTKTPDRLFRASATLRQPYLFAEQLSGSIEPFIQERRSVSLDQNPNRAFSLLERLGLNERQFGLNTTLIYTFLPFRSLSLQHTLARTEQFGGIVDSDSARAQTDLFDKSIFTLNGTFGKADDFINPDRGFIIRPSAAVGGGTFSSGVNFWRGSMEASGYLPLSASVQLAGRLFGGGLFPFGKSRDNLAIGPGARDSLLNENQTYQDRFSDHLFYAGGGSDVRGWRSQLAGGKALRNIGTEETPDYAYRPIGAQSKVGVNLEARLPFPGLGDRWRTALFMDAAYLETGDLNLVPSPEVSDVVAGPSGTAIRTKPSRLLVGAGAGLRYQTPFGFVRLDLAYKLTPDQLDLRRPNDIRSQIEKGSPTPVRDADPRTLRRFRFHFGIGRSF
ncbi:BamA/TamA family outer membrane protein [Salinibacter sp. 10B]|uniref:BamA/OMP85 family outer membrane protein n=1 Tax=Salinibacter sp. 10B TaxID=1923971 RepID=UPI002157461F|nr:BamA/TamA family outer membrane protein [Salinibacter sp. 10B]